MTNHTFPTRRVPKLRPPLTNWYITRPPLFQILIDFSRQNDSIPREGNIVVMNSF